MAMTMAFVVVDSWQDDSLLCDISLKSLSRSSKPCTDSDCSFELCCRTMPKKQNHQQPQQQQQHVAANNLPTATITANTGSSKKKQQQQQQQQPSKSVDSVTSFFWQQKQHLRDAGNCVASTATTTSTGARMPMYRIPSVLIPLGHLFSLDLHKIPKQILDDPRLALDLESFMQIMRSGRIDIDTNTVDVTLDPFASEFVWRYIHSPDFHRYPDLQRLANQLCSRIKQIDEKDSMSDDDIDFVKNLTRFNYREFRVNRIKDQTVDMQQLRDTDPALILINRAIYSKPSPLSLDYHKAAEEFALNANCFEKLDEPTTHQMNSSSRTTPNKPSNNNNNNIQQTTATTPQQLFEPKQSSTPIKSAAALSLASQSTWRNSPMEQTLVQQQQQQPLYSRILQRNLVNSGVTNFQQQQRSGDTSDRMLYPQTMLLTSPTVPTVYPDMTNPATLIHTRNSFKYSTSLSNHNNTFIERLYSSMQR